MNFGVGRSGCVTFKAVCWNIAKCSWSFQAKVDTIVGAFDRVGDVWHNKKTTTGWLLEQVDHMYMFIHQTKCRLHGTQVERERETNRRWQHRQNTTQHNYTIKQRHSREDHINSRVMCNNKIGKKKKRATHYESDGSLVRPVSDWDLLKLSLLRDRWSCVCVCVCECVRLCVALTQKSEYILCSYMKVRS